MTGPERHKFDGPKTRLFWYGKFFLSRITTSPNLRITFRQPDCKMMADDGTNRVLAVYNAFYLFGWLFGVRK